MRISVDTDKCTLCGACIPTCPAGMVRSKGDHIKIGHVACIECGHCIAICPEGALAAEDAPPPEPALEAAPSPQVVRDIIRSRRTVRRYRPEPVARELIEECLDAGRWVPTAANCQAQEYIVVMETATKDELRRRIEEHYRRFGEALADKENRAARLVALNLDPEADTRPHMLVAVPAFVKGVEAGLDRLFFEAPVVIVIHAAREEVMSEDACGFAALSLSLMAAAQGLGTCITGYASDALRARPEIREWLGIPPENQVHKVVLLGWPEEEFLPRAGEEAGQRAVAMS